MIEYLSTTTALIPALLPFLFIFYQNHFTDDLKALKFANVIFLLANFFLLGFLFKELYFYDLDWDRPLIFLHITPLIFNIFLVLVLKSFRGGFLNSDEGGYNPASLKSKVEKISWDSLIISDSLKEELLSVINLLKDPKSAKKYGLDIPKGILFNGPPGTGKTTIAKVLANEAGLSFFALRLDEVISKWVGESEKNLTKLFTAAARASPSVIFIDEIDSIGKQRTGGSGENHRETLLNHLLQLIDGVFKQDGIYLIAATNRADLVDSALTRAGRFNRAIEIGLPDIVARQRLFELYLKKIPLDVNVDCEGLARMTEGHSPADIKDICNKASLNAYKRESKLGKKEFSVQAEDLQKALEEG